MKNKERQLTASARGVVQPPHHWGRLDHVS